MTTTSSWKVPSGGIFTNPNGWTGGVPNSGASDAILPTLSQAYTVTTTSANNALDFLEVDADSTLSVVDGSTFSIDSTVHNYSNVYDYGSITVGSDSTIEFGGTAAADSAEINGPGTTTLLGTGTTAGTIATMRINAPYFGLYGG